MFLRNSMRRVLAVAFMGLLAVVFVGGVLSSDPALTNQLRVGGNELLLRVFGDSSSDTTAQEETTEDSRSEKVAFDAAFVHRAAPENIVNNSTYLDNALANGDPDAILYVTQNWNPGGSRGTYNDHPVGVWYDANRLRWAIFNQDLAAMPEGAAFNIVVLKDSTEAA